MFSMRSLHLFALGALLSAPVLAGPTMQTGAAAQIILKQTSTNFAPRVSQRDIQRMREEERIRDQRIRERQAAQRRSAEEKRQILQQQRVGRSILFGKAGSGKRSDNRGGGGVAR